MRVTNVCIIIIIINDIKNISLKLQRKSENLKNHRRWILGSWLESRSKVLQKRKISNSIATNWISQIHSQLVVVAQRFACRRWRSGGPQFKSHPRLTSQSWSSYELNHLGLGSKASSCRFNLKDLGNTIEPNLKFCQHINNITAAPVNNKAWLNSCCVSLLRILQLLFEAFVHPLLEYIFPVWQFGLNVSDNIKWSFILCCSFSELIINWNLFWK